jgi:hypothetical protein
MPESQWLSQLGRLLIISGVVLVAVGLLLYFSDRIPWLGRLPGDLSFKSGKIRIYIPIATSILLSIILTIILNLFRR